MHDRLFSQVIYIFFFQGFPIRMTNFQQEKKSNRRKIQLWWNKSTIMNVKYRKLMHDLKIETQRQIPVQTYMTLFENENKGKRKMKDIRKW